MQPLLIGPYEKGVIQNVKPFMVPDEAWTVLNNTMVWRQQTRRKSGYSLLGRLTLNLSSASAGTVSAGGAGVVTFNSFTQLALNTISPNAQFALGTMAVPLVITIAAPISQTLTDTTGTGTFVVSAGGPITAATVNYSTGVLSITFSAGAAASAVTISGNYYPGLPVMGIRTFINPTSINQENYIFFDTVYSYRFSGGFSQLPSTIPTTWSGTDAQQFWTTNYQGTLTTGPIFWATNDVATNNGFIVTATGSAAGGPPSTVQVTTETAITFNINDVVVFTQMTGGIPNYTIATVTATSPFTVSNPGTGIFSNGSFTGLVSKLSNQNGIRYYDGTSWNPFTPQTNIAGTNYVLGCLLIVPYKSRLVIFNTFEGTTGNVTNYRQRARWCWTGNPTDVVNGWRDDRPGYGGYDDAATDESIISCGFMKDELIVYFEHSTWKLVFTGNEIDPFIWQRINAELGADSAFSPVQFDAGLLAIGNVGVHTCNGSQVQRIDAVIPDEVFNIRNSSDGPQRVSGIRDFFQEIVYWAYPIGTKFPNKMMIYNYKTSQFSFFDDQATTFGYFQSIADTPWYQLTQTSWAGWDTPWNSGVIKAAYPSVAFGNQEGFVEVILPFITTNNPSLSITDFSAANQITAINHNLIPGQYITITGAIGITGVNNTTFMVTTVVDANNFTFDGTATGTYLGGGLITVLTNVQITTKAFTPFWEKGKNYTLKYFDVLVDSTKAGELQVDIYIDFNMTQSMTNTSSGVVLGAPILSTAPEGSNLPYYSYQNSQQQIWKRFYTVATGETFQISFSMNDAEMRSPGINQADIVIHAMVLYFEEAGGFY